MKALFISHPDFYSLEPINVFHKELDDEGRLIKLPDLHPDTLKNKHVIYRKKFTLPKFEKATLRISADDYYKLYVNGKYVTEGPAPSYYHSYLYSELDISEYLCEGENVIAVHCYYQGLINRVWVSGDLKQMLWCELYTDGELSLVSDESWKCKYHTGYAEYGKFGYDTAYGECYDAGAPEARFYETGFDDGSFERAREHKAPTWHLVPQKTRQLDVYSMAPERIEECDFGLRIFWKTEAVGALQFTAVGNAKDEIILRYGEELLPSGEVRYDMRANCKYEEKMILSGGVDLLMQYDYKAFRYAELHFKKGIKIDGIVMRVRHYPFEATARYKAENKKLKAILSLCENTIKYSTQERFLDCPTREKGAYLGDLMVSGRAHVAITRDLTLIKHAIENFLDSAFICKGLMACSCGALMQEIADYSLEFPALLNWIYSIDGDEDFLRKCEPYATGIYEYYKKYEREDGLLEQVIEWNLVDWPDNLRDGYDFPLTRPVGKGVHNVICALWYGLKIALEELYATLGIKRELNTELTKRSFIGTFLCESTGLYTDAPGSTHSAVHSSVFPLLFNIGTENEKIRTSLIEHIRSKGLSSMGVYMAYFTLAALKNAGEAELCEQLACDDKAWLNMINEGASMTFEAWGKEQKWNTSLCHPWATAPLIIFSDLRAY